MDLVDGLPDETVGRTKWFGSLVDLDGDITGRAGYSVDTGAIGFHNTAENQTIYISPDALFAAVDDAIELKKL